MNQSWGAPHAARAKVLPPRAHTDPKAAAPPAPRQPPHLLGSVLWTLPSEV